MHAPATVECDAPAATLRFVPPGEESEQMVTLDSLPFVVGRADSANLRIDSNRVSREHAVFQWEDGHFWVRDLGSTNGTFVNDKRVERERLTHGEVFKVADIEMRLELDGDSSLGRQELVSRLRCWNEMLLCRGMGVGFAPVWDLRESRLCGSMVAPLDSHTNEVAIWPAPGLSGLRISQKMHWMMMVRAAEAARALPLEMPLLLTAAATRDAEQWLAMLAQQAEGRQLVIAVPKTTPARTDMVSVIQSFGFDVACEVSWGESIVEGCRHVWLSREYTTNIAADESRWKTLATVVEQAAAQDAAVVALGLEDEDSVHVCTELGCAAGTGTVFGQPRTASELASN